MQHPALHWLPRHAAWSSELTTVPSGAEAWPALCALARHNLDALETRALDRHRARLIPEPPAGIAMPPVRLAVLASSTVDHLLAGIRAGGLRRDLWIETHTPDYGQYARSLIASD